MTRKITFTLTAFFLAATSLLAQNPTISHGVWKQDYDALVTIYDSLNGDNWQSYKKTNWKSSKDVSEWANVKVKNQRVVELNLRYNRELKGTVPNDINELTALRKLNFFYTNISKLPNNLSGLVSLVDLNLSYTQLSGEIPASLGNLKKLKNINFEKNKFSGTIPSFAGCDSLENLNLNNNQLSGAIPSFADCNSLVSLKLNHNQLTGAIPEGFGGLKKLQRLEFDKNQLSGQIPSDLGNSKTLEALILSDNQLKGKVPATLNNASKLNTLRLQGNKLSHLPDLSSFQVGTSITNINFNFANNYFDFEDFERANLHNSISKTFSPQSIIKLKKEVSGKKITLTMTDNTTVNNSYQWYRSKIAIAGATSQSYVITDSTTAKSGEYYCEVKHSIFSDTPTNLTLSSEKIQIGMSHGVFQQDYDALVAIYNALDGDNWNNKNNWLSNKNVDEWYGVDRVAGNRVVDLDLSDNNLKGQIPTVIEKLTGLEDLRFKQNKDVTGAVPKEIGKLANLTALHLQECKLTLMPEDFKHLTKMKYCYLYDNLFESLPDLSGFTVLSKFRIQNNQFDFTALKAMNANVANWYQYSPQDSIAISVKETEEKVILTALDKSTENNVYQWYKDGEIIANANKQTFRITDANRKDSMGVYHCQITNSDFNKLTLHTKKTTVNELKGGVLGKDYLVLLKLYDALNGDNWKKKTNWKSDKNVSEWFGIKVANERVSEIVLNENGLKGTLPADIGNLDSLKVLYMNWNELENSIPVEIGNLKVLRVLDVYNNKLTGNIPTQIGNLVKLDSLDLSGNQLSGVIPEEIGNLKALTFTSLAANRLSGNLPETVGNLTNLIKFTIENNELSGNLPTTIGNLKKVVDFWIYQNKFSGALPKEIGDMTKLGYFRADTNEFTSIPKEIGKLKELRELWLTHNQLVGELPEEIGELTGMNSNGDIRLDDNKLTGTFPLFFTKLTGLENLGLSTNQFSGTLPKEIGNFTALTNIDLDSNRFEGPVPAEIAIRTMQTLQLCNNQFTSLPDLSTSKFDFLLYCQVSQNKLDFADLKKANVTISYPANGYTYTPQDSVMVKIIQTGSKVLLSSTDTIVSNNVYQWYKDGKIIANANKQTFTINDVYQTDSMGVYHCQITNSDFDKLTLYTEKTKLIFGTDATLADLKVNGKTISNFEKETLEYNIELPYGTTAVPVVTATATDSLAKVVITPTNKLPGETKIVVTAENETIKTYSINFIITAPSTDATLADLKVNGKTISNFEKETLEYNVELPYGTTAVPVVTATATDSLATIKYAQATSVNGKATIVVTAQDTTRSKKYVVKFTVKTGIKDNSVASISAYPNPSTDGQFILETSGKGSIQIISLSGEMIQQFDIISKKTIVNIYKSGIYILKYFNNNDIVIEKIIIQ